MGGTQLQVTGALVALGAITAIGLWKTRRSGLILTREENLDYLKLRLNEGPNDIRVTVQQYLSCYKYQVQFKKFPGHEEQSRFCIIYLSQIPR